MELNNTEANILFLICLFIILSLVLGIIMLNNSRKNKDKQYSKLLEDSNILLLENNVKKTNVSNSIAKTLIGSVVVSFPNEWQDPLFIHAQGYIDETDHCEAVLYGYDLLTEQTSYMFVSSAHICDEMFLSALLKLDPFERWNFTAGRNMKTNMWSKSYPISNDDLTPKNVIRNRVRRYIRNLNEKEIYRKESI